ncbi:MAG: zf-HC2 domain-containing protein [bacterium]
MSCYKPRLSERLLQYLENLLSPRERTEMESHIRSCTDCKEELDALQKDCRTMNLYAAYLKKTNTSMRSAAPEPPVIFARTSSACPPANVLVLYAQKEALISAGEKENIENHLLNCTTCRQAAEVLWQIEEELTPEKTRSLISGAPESAPAEPLPARLSEAVRQGRSALEKEKAAAAETAVNFGRREEKKSGSAEEGPDSLSLLFEKLRRVFASSVRWQYVGALTLILVVLGLAVLFFMGKSGSFHSGDTALNSLKSEPSPSFIEERVVLSSPEIAQSPTPALQTPAPTASRVLAVASESPQKTPSPEKQVKKKAVVKKSPRQKARVEKRPPDKKVFAFQPPFAPMPETTKKQNSPVPAAALTRHLAATEEKSDSVSLQSGPEAVQGLYLGSQGNQSAEVGRTVNAGTSSGSEKAAKVASESSSALADYESLLEEELQQKISQALGGKKASVRVVASLESPNVFIPAVGVKSKDSASAPASAAKRLPIRSLKVTIRPSSGLSEEQKASIKKIISESGRFDEARGDSLEFK